MATSKNPAPQDQPQDDSTTPPTVAEDTPTTDPVDERLAELRRRLAEQNDTDPRLAEIAKLETQLAAPSTASPWESIPKVGTVPDDQLDPRVADLLRALQNAQDRNDELVRQLASGQGVSREAVAAPDAHLFLACGHSTVVASSVPTHHHCAEHDQTVRVLSANLAE